jgi:ABC-type transport system substrate-binding protein
MSSWNSNDTMKGAVLGLLAFVLVSSSMPLQTVSVHAATGPYFTMTLIAPTSNPQRRQWAAIIQNSYESANIDAKLIYVSFSQMLSILLGCANGCPAKSFANGGWDATFVGNGGGTSLPDLGTQNVAFYRNEGPGDVPPAGQDYYFFKNTTFNALADDYNTNFNINQRLADAQKMVAIAAQERPGIIILYPLSVYAYDSAFKPWGVSATGNAPSASAPLTSSAEGFDYAHWNTGSTSAINVGLTGNIDNVNQLPTAAQNSLYDRYIWGPISDFTEQIDARAVGVYYNAVANSITSSSDHKTWTVTIKAHNFQDGVPVTADDYLFAMMSQLRLDVGYVGGGTLQGLLGTNGAAFAQFTYLNGTTRYVGNGTYSMTQPSNWTPTSSWKSDNKTAFTFTMPTPYILTDPIVTAFSSLPMHIYEKVKASTWATSFLSGFTGSSGGLSTNHVTVTWNTAQYGGNGSYAWVYGPVGDGPYMYRGYDATSQTATLVKWSGYWNATGLQGMGEFTANTIHIQSILAKDAAIAAFGNHQVNFLDTNYGFNPQDIAALQGLGATVIQVADPANGWQEMPLNDNNPVFGTGVATPAGSAPGATAAQQAAAARNVRKALSYLVPRQEIIDNLLGGLALPGITQYYPSQGVIKAGDIYNGITADPYNPTMAASFLAAAGYNTGVAPPTPGEVVTPPTNTNASIPSFFLGNSFTLAGIYQPVNVATMLNYSGFAVVLEQSIDNGSTWQAVSDAYTNVGGYYTLTYTPTASGSAWYRLFFTGVPVSYLNGLGYGSPASIEALVPPVLANRTFWQNVTTTSYGSTSKLTIGSLGNELNKLQVSLNSIETSQMATNSTVAALKASVDSLTSSVNTQQTVAYAALGVAIVLGVVAIGLALRKRPGT